MKNDKKLSLIIFLAMLNISITLCKGLFSYRLVQLGAHTLQAGQFIAPLWFILCDITAELFGYQISMFIIISSFICQTLFTLACTSIIHLPFPTHAADIANAYQLVFQNMWQVDLAVLSAYIFAGYINIKLLTRWKVLLNGRYFMLRSLGSSGISELLFSFLATFFIQLGKQPLLLIFQMGLMSFVLKIIYSVALTPLANFFVATARYYQLSEETQG